MSRFLRLQRQATGQELASFALAKRIATRIPHADLTTLSEPELWTAHAEGMSLMRERTAREDPSRASLLAVKTELARRLLAPCRLCWLECPVDRTHGPAGRCGLGPGLRVYRDFVHLGEERELIPTHAVYLAGCSFRCPYCSEWALVDRPLETTEVAPERLARSIQAHRAQGALTLSFVGGEPTMSLPGILAALSLADTSVPVVWNSNLSGTSAAHDLLEGVVDAWVPDLKTANEQCARGATGAKGALEVVQRNLLRVAREAWTIVRHLVLPGHVDCCTLPVLEWIAAHLPEVRVNLMPQYSPSPEVRGTAWDARPGPDDLERAIAHARALGLDLRGQGSLGSFAPTPSAPRPLPVAAFESRIRSGDDGEVVIEDLDPGLLDVARELGGDDPDLEGRASAARPWTGDGGHDG